MRRGQVWTAQRAGHQRLVVIVGHDALTAARDGVLVVPISDVREPSLVEPELSLTDGTPAGVATTPRVGEIDKTYLVEQRGVLAPQSRDSLDIALRAALDV
ncbi:MAG: type II toxin-antitoxin system PemK/MazF family toxin [Natronosporangium sp.]